MFMNSQLSTWFFYIQWFIFKLYTFINQVRKFLEMTKEGSDYEDKVRNFLEETARFKRDRKMQELGTQEHEKSSKARKKAKKESK